MDDSLSSILAKAEAAPRNLSAAELPRLLALEAPDDLAQLYAAANAPKKELLMIPGAVHAAASQADQQTYFRTIRKFVQPYMEEQK